MWIRVIDGNHYGRLYISLTSIRITGTVGRGEKIATELNKIYQAFAAKKIDGVDTYAKLFDFISAKYNG